MLIQHFKMQLFLILLNPSHSVRFVKISLSSCESEYLQQKCKLSGLRDGWRGGVQTGGVGAEGVCGSDETSVS